LNSETNPGCLRVINTNLIKLRSLLNNRINKIFDRISLFNGMNNTTIDFV